MTNEQQKVRNQLDPLEPRRMHFGWLSPAVPRDDIVGSEIRRLKQIIAECDQLIAKYSA